MLVVEVEHHTLAEADMLLVREVGHIEIEQDMDLVPLLVVVEDRHPGELVAADHMVFAQE
jgi:hypothetical protein